MVSMIASKGSVLRRSGLTSSGNFASNYLKNFCVASSFDVAIMATVGSSLTLFPSSVLASRSMSFQPPGTCRMFFGLISQWA